MLTLIIFIAVLAVLVLSHEFGHFIAAKKSGMKVEEFGFGFPPKIFGIKKGGTIYSLNWLPLGGFVKIKGENGDNSTDADSFSARPIWQRAVVLMAGVAMNVVLAAVLLMVGYMVGLPQAIDGIDNVSNIADRRLEVVQVIDGKPAATAGVLSGDVIVSVNGTENPRLKMFQDYVNAHGTEKIAVTFRRGNEVITKEIAPAVYADTGRAGIGVAVAELGTVSYPWYRAIYEGILTTGWYLKEIVLAFYLLIVGIFAGAGVGGAVSGPVGIALMTGQAARLGLAYLLQFTAMLSLNLAILNILPIPALDGGRLLFLLIEKIKGAPVKQKLEQWAHTIGFALLLLLIVVVTVKDLGNFRGAFMNLIQKIF